MSKFLKDLVLSTRNRIGLLIILLAVFFEPSKCYGQPLPIDLPIFNESVRRAQLMGQVDKSSSLMIRPSMPLQSDSAHGEYTFDRIISGFKSPGVTSSKKYLNGKGVFRILPASYQTQLNSNHPYGWGDGSMINNRGYQHTVNAGIYNQIGPLSIQLRPEWIYAQNKAFDGFPEEFPAYYLNIRRSFWVTADPPERFGTKAYSRGLLGQSYLKFNIKPISFGLSNENIWWGPGQFNALIFSNNARGFNHFTINSTKPVHTFLGHFEGQLLIGKLMPPDFDPNYGRLELKKNPDWRYLSAVNVTYSPRWVPGLYFSFMRTFQIYKGDLGNKLKDYLPILDAFQKETVGLSEDQKNRSQQVAVSLRWLFDAAQTEIYFEYGRRDHSLNWRDFIMSPDHARAYLWGFNKLFKTSKSAFIQVRFEAVQTQQSVNIMVRYLDEGGGQSWGSHSPVANGFSNFGQQLGNGVGPGNNSQTLEVAWVKDIRKLGVIFERLDHQMDFFNIAFRDSSPARPWVDISTGLVGNWRFNRLVANAKIQFIKSLNYQWQQDFTYPGGQNAKGVDRFNLHSYMGVSYVF